MRPQKSKTIRPAPIGQTATITDKRAKKNLVITIIDEEDNKLKKNKKLPRKQDMEVMGVTISTWNRLQVEGYIKPIVISSVCQCGNLGSELDAKITQLTNNWHVEVPWTVICGHSRYFRDGIIAVKDRNVGDINLDDATEIVIKLIKNGVKKITFCCCEFALNAEMLNRTTLVKNATDKEKIDEISKSYSDYANAGEPDENWSSLDIVCSKLMHRLADDKNLFLAFQSAQSVVLEGLIGVGFISDHLEGFNTTDQVDGDKIDAIKSDETVVKSFCRKARKTGDLMSITLNAPPIDEPLSDWDAEFKFIITMNEAIFGHALKDQAAALCKKLPVIPKRESHQIPFILLEVLKPWKTENMAITQTLCKFIGDQAGEAAINTTQLECTISLLLSCRENAEGSWIGDNGQFSPPECVRNIADKPKYFNSWLGSMREYYANLPTMDDK